MSRENRAKTTNARRSLLLFLEIFCIFLSDHGVLVVIIKIVGGAVKA
jgi:hypothetical protein